VSLDPRFLATAIEAAACAGAVIKPYFRAKLETERKSDQSPVTIADRAAEQAMRALLQQRFPDHGILGEEFGLYQPEAPYRWVLDPIDGTRAFITGRPMFGTLISLMLDGRPILGLIDQPVTGERWLRVDGEPTTFSGPFGGTPHTRLCPTLAQAELSCTSPDMLGSFMPAWRSLADAVARISWGGDCYAYGLLALGQIDIIAECDLKIWDWAALLPVVEGAGGCLTDWQGQGLDPDRFDGRVLAVGDPALLDQAVERLNGVTARR
jgi:histidinol phosphatase-like enzyme (inositol monophosphatase family)